MDENDLIKVNTVNKAYAVAAHVLSRNYTTMSLCYGQCSRPSEDVVLMSVWVRSRQMMYDNCGIYVISFLFFRDMNGVL